MENNNNKSHYVTYRRKVEEPPEDPHSGISGSYLKESQSSLYWLARVSTIYWIKSSFTVIPLAGSHTRLTKEEDNGYIYIYIWIHLYKLKKWHVSITWELVTFEGWGLGAGMISNFSLSLIYFPKHPLFCN